MKRFLVWIYLPIPGHEGYEETVEMPDSATEAECEAACADCLDVMIGNCLDTGWGPLDELTPRAKRT